MRQAFFGSIFFLASFIPESIAATTVPDGFGDLVEKLTPAVVNITTTQKPTKSDMRYRGMNGFEEFQEFFEQFMGPMPKEQDDRRAMSLGSGFIIDPKGYIVTNQHVIADSEEIEIRLNDDTKLIAEVVGSDTRTDLALLKVDYPKPLPHVKFGNSDDVRVGEWILAIGNPFGLGGTVTAGIISAKARDINAGTLSDYLQTDAAINRGNSGGPMFNMKGEVIGVNTAIFSTNASGGSIGIGFATPSSIAKSVTDQLQKTGKVRRAWLGIKMQAITPEIAESLGRTPNEGVLVAEVSKDTPAERGGLKSGDIILKFNGQLITSTRHLQRLVTEMPIGSKVTMTLLRNGKEIKVNVTLGELKDDQKSDTPDEEKEEKATGQEALGMLLSPITDELRDKYGITKDVKGLLITKVMPRSEVAKRGLKAGDVIVSVNQETVATAKDFKKLVEQAKKEKKKSLLFLVNRQASTIFIPIGID